jgi:hypothetical protein
MKRKGFLLLEALISLFILTFAGAFNLPAGHGDGAGDR